MISWLGEESGYGVANISYLYAFNEFLAPILLAVQDLSRSK